MPEEIWKPILLKETKTNYEVSDQGNIRNIKSNKPLKKIIDPEGYDRVNIYINDKKTYSRYVHRLVLIAFDHIENHNKFHVHHKDGNKINNRLANLQWITPKDHNILETRKGNNKVGKFGKDSLQFKGHIGQFTREGILKNIIEGRYEMKLLNFSNGAIYQSVNNTISEHKGFVFRRFPADVKPEIGKNYDLFDPVFMQFFKTDSSKNINHSYKQLELSLV
jgi:hypothetical protein